MLMIVAGLTGSFGAGKSAVAAMFAEAGIPVMSADDAAREVVAPGSDGLRRVIETFGQGLLQPDGALDRKKLADRVFDDPDELRKLNAIVHPRVYERMGRFVHEHKQAPITVLEIPLLFETGGRRLVDKVIVVRADEKCRFGRLKRRGFGEREIVKRLGAQMPQSRKTALADAVIENSGSLEQTRQQVRELMKQWGVDPSAFATAGTTT